MVSQSRNRYTYVGYVLIISLATQVWPSCYKRTMETPLGCSDNGTKSFTSSLPPCTGCTPKRLMYLQPARRSQLEPLSKKCCHWVLHYWAVQYLQVLQGIDIYLGRMKSPTLRLLSTRDTSMCFHGKPPFFPMTPNITRYHYNLIICTMLMYLYISLIGDWDFASF